mmetsp:Transcript_34475/g.52756  ORF Transcript_34475/g.52756 Transcript_34475/m.52756 type:complete len:104 (+) Transcript_34475:704-1015(+)
MGLPLSCRGGFTAFIALYFVTGDSKCLAKDLHPVRLLMASCEEGFIMDFTSKVSSDLGSEVRRADLSMAAYLTNLATGYNLSHFIEVVLPLRINRTTVGSSNS